MAQGAPQERPWRKLSGAPPPWQVLERHRHRDRRHLPPPPPHCRINCRPRGRPFCRTFCSPFLACNFVSWHLRWWGLLHPLSEARELNGETRVFAFGERVQAPICVNRCSARVAPCRFETSFLPPCDCFWAASLHFWCARCVLGEGRTVYACPVVLVVA